MRQYDCPAGRNPFLKAFIRLRFPAFLLLAVLLAGCAAYDPGNSLPSNRQSVDKLKNSFVIAPQVSPPREIQSVQLYPESDESAPPIIRLKGNQKLTLEFDHLDAGVRQFKVTISHRGKNWEESPIPPSVYLETFSEDFFGDGRKSFVQNPTYHHYTYQFPSERLRITKSGNYLLSVHDYRSDDLLFRIPFFVSEDQGRLDTRIETLFAQRSDGRSLAQPFSEYRYPPFVQQPQFDLSYMFVQNQLLGHAKFSERFDTATPGIVNFHLSRDKSFISDFEFRELDLRSFDADGQQIVDIRPGSTPPGITLRRDVQQFESRPSRYPDTSPLGITRDDRQATYGLVEFSFEPSASIKEDAGLYIVGDFNNWMIDEANRMRYDSTAALWKGTVLIKQGIYSYKYVLLRDNQIDALSLDRMYARTRQQYTTFVYFRDPQRNYYRLLKTETISQ